MNHIADTTVLVDHLRGDAQAKKYLEEKIPAISTATIAELIQGAKNKKELGKILDFVGKFPEETISLKISKTAIELLINYSISHGLKFMDALIAATAITNQSILVSDNIKHFRFISELEVVSHQQAFKNS